MYSVHVQQINLQFIELQILTVSQYKYAYARMYIQNWTYILEQHELC